MPEPRRSNLKFLSVSNAIRGDETRRRRSGHSSIALTLLVVMVVCIVASAVLALVRRH